MRLLLAGLVVIALATGIKRTVDDYRRKREFRRELDDVLRNEKRPR